MTAPVSKRADQLVVGDRILPHRLPAPYFKEPGEVVFVKVHDYRKGRYVFVAYVQDNGFYDSTSYEPDGEVEVYPAPPLGHDYSRAGDGETTQPIAGRLPAHLEDGRTGEVVMVGGQTATPVNEVDDSLSEPGYPVYAPCQPIGCDNGHHLPGCVFIERDQWTAMANAEIEAD
jgi:hypothetical protein